MPGLRRFAMTKRDYIIIAAALAQARRQCGEGVDIEGVQRVEDELCKVLQRDNPNFNATLFKAAAT